MAGGGGFGSIHHMILTLKNNNDLLKRRGLIRRKKDFYTIRKEYLKASKGKLDFKKTRKEEIEALRKQLLYRRRIRIFTDIAIFTFIIFLATVISLSAIKKDNAKEKQYNRVSKIKKEQIKKRDHKYLLEWGNYNLRDQDYAAALNDFQSALKLYPNDFETNLKLAQTYSLYCQISPSEYKNACYFLKEAIKDFPDSVILYKIRAELRLKMGEIEKAEKDFNKMDSLLLMKKN